MLTVNQTKAVANQIMALLKDAGGKPVRRGQVLAAIARGQGFASYEAYRATAHSPVAPGGAAHPLLLVTGTDDEILPAEREKATRILEDQSGVESIHETTDGDSYYLVTATDQVIMVSEGTAKTAWRCRAYAYDRGSDKLHAMLSSEISFETFERFFGGAVALRHAEFYESGDLRKAIAIPPLDPAVAAACRRWAGDQPLVAWFAYGAACGAFRFLAPDIAAVGDDIQEAVDIFGDVFDVDTALVTDILPVHFADQRFAP